MVVGQIELTFAAPGIGDRRLWVLQHGIVEIIECYFDLPIFDKLNPFLKSPDVFVGGCFMIDQVIAKYQINHE